MYWEVDASYCPASINNWQRSQQLKHFSQDTPLDPVLGIGHGQDNVGDEKPARMQHLCSGSLSVARGRELTRQEGGLSAELQGSTSIL